MTKVIHKLNDSIIKKLWGKEPAAGSFHRFVLRSLRLIFIAVRGLFEEQLALRAMSLVYTTLLSLVPLLAVSFSVLKALGVHTKFEIFLYYFLEPLGEKGIDLSMKLISFVENVKESVLGALGLSMLLYTVVSQIQKLERSLNFIWHVKGTRSFTRRFSSYLSVVLVGPVVIFSAAGITAAFMSTDIVRELKAIKTFGIIMIYAGRVLPYLLASAAFTFIYISLPNTKVRFIPALTGGIFAGVVWKITGMIFTAFILSSARYSAIYSGFALIILFLIWLYWSWLVLLVGARITFYHQYPYFSPYEDGISLKGSRARERLALSIMFLIGESFYYNRETWKLESLLKRLGIAADEGIEVLDALKNKGLVAASADSPPAYFPAKDIETITVNEVINSVRLSADEKAELSATLSELPAIYGIMSKIDSAITFSIEKETIKSLVVSAGKT